MITLDNSDKIFESDNTLVYRGVRTTDKQPVILKILKENYPSPEKLAHYRQEYEITSHLKPISGVIDTYNLEKYQKSPVIVLEDFGGESLDKFIDKETKGISFEGRCGISVFLNLAIQITEILGQIHAANVIHKDINPSNIILNPKTGQLKLIDFGISTILARENPTLKNPEHVEGTLAYISPEQTGRMNRTVDYRTDFYSLGITFYQLLTQQLPFDTQEAMALVHCHIAKQPLSPNQLNSDIPPVISDIIMKLLAKTAEERYQSAWGLKADLQKCQLQLANRIEIEKFSLGQQDFSEQWQWPQKLYGRESEIKILLTAFDCVANPENKKTEILLVSGYSGIGKSSLVREIYKPITEKRGYFVSGKFEQWQRNVPYAAFVNAFKELVRQLLTENELQLAKWKTKILKVVGSNGQIIIDVIPEVEEIIDQQSPVSELPPAESQNRFNLVFQNFIKVFTQAEHPLVIFLDDLQWVDSASLKLLQWLMDATDINALLIIGAYRDHEVYPAHPLLLTIKDLQTTHAVVNHISLKPLSLSDVAQLITEALQCDINTAYPLAELSHQKTGGNPFFLNEFLKSLSAEKLLTFDSQTGRWQWQLSQIQARDFTDNVVELLINKIRQLPIETQNALRIAACIGHQFEIKTLATVLETNAQQTITDLRPAILNEQLSVISKQLPTKIDLTTDNWALITACRFNHDRIQQAAYSLIPDEQKIVVHRQIGQLLLQNTPLEKREQNIFAMVEQLNVGKHLTIQQSERNELAELNLIAGKKAKASAAYSVALNYLKIGLELLDEASWQTQYPLTLSLHEEATEAAYLSGHFEQMEQWIDMVLQNANTVLDKVRIYEIKMQAYAVQNKALEIIQTARQILQSLQMPLPETFSLKKLKLEILKIRIRFILVRKRINHLKSLPKMVDSRKQSAIRILSRLGPPIFFRYPMLSFLTSLKIIHLSIKYGNANESVYGYIVYGVFLCGKLNKINSGYQFGLLALNLSKQFNVKYLKARMLGTMGNHIQHWKEPLREALKSCQKAYQDGLDSGDLEFAGYCAIVVYHYSYFSGKALAKVKSEILLYSGIFEKVKHERVIYHNKLIKQVIYNLTTSISTPLSLLQEKFFSEAEILTSCELVGDQVGIFYLYLHKCILFYLFDEYNQSHKNSKIAEQNLGEATGLFGVPVLYFYSSLVFLGLYKSATKQKQRQYRKKIRANQKKMKHWAYHAPMNYQHKFDLVEAEWHHHVLGKDCKAMNLYDKAIAGAKENGYLNEEALGYELAAKFYLAKGKHNIAQIYFRDAHYAYKQWGALAKVKQLEENYPEFFVITETEPNPAITMTHTIKLASIDVINILEASQAIASETDEKGLLKKLMNIVLAEAGAQRGVLILDKAGKWFIEAEGAIGTDEITVLQSKPLSQLSIPTKVINYVARLKESIVLADATQDERLTDEPYLENSQIKSIVCVPLLKQDQIKGLLYLEHQDNNVFSPRRVETLKLLSSQIVISLENAQHHAEMANMNITYQKEIAELKKRIEALETSM